MQYVYQPRITDIHVKQKYFDFFKLIEIKPEV